MADADMGLQRQFFEFNSRLARIEKRMNSINDELQINRSDAIDKHREALKQVSSVKASVVRLEAEITDTKKLAERLTQMLGEFASKDSVKVLEKYINMWSPIDYITRPEADSLIEKALSKKKPESKAKTAPANKKRYASTKLKNK